MTSPDPLKIFLSYRRSETAQLAGRLAASLNQMRDVESVFHDVKAIRIGSRFRVDIDRELATATHVLVLIGSEWATVKNAQGRRRLFEPGDHVCHEVATALMRRNCTVVPILLDDAQMPAGEDLPMALQELPRINAYSFRVSKYEVDLEVFMTELLGQRPRLRDEQTASSGASTAIVRGLTCGLAGLLGATTFGLVTVGYLHKTPAQIFGMPGSEDMAIALWIMVLFGVWGVISMALYGLWGRVKGAR
jgi:hypothetical protein